MMKATIVGVAVCAVALGGFSEAAKPPSDSPVSALYRCPTTAECVSPDAIAGDGQGAIVGNLATRHGAFIQGDGSLDIHLTPSDGRSMTYDFNTPDGPPPCQQTATGCRRTFTVALSTDNYTLSHARTPTDQPLPNDFYGVPVGGSAPARFKVNFVDPNGLSYLWTIRFSPVEYPGSTFVRVTRPAANVWEVEATAADRGRLVSVNVHGGPQVMTDEGLFVMPFKLTIVK